MAKGRPKGIARGTVRGKSKPRGIARGTARDRVSRETHLGKASAKLKRRSTERGTLEISSIGLGYGP